MEYFLISKTSPFITKPAFQSRPVVITVFFPAVTESLYIFKRYVFTRYGINHQAPFGDAYFVDYFLYLSINILRMTLTPVSRYGFIYWNSVSSDLCKGFRFTNYRKASLSGRISRILQAVPVDLYKRVRHLQCIEVFPVSKSVFYDLPQVSVPDIVPQTSPIILVVGVACEKGIPIIKPQLFPLSRFRKN